MSVAARHTPPASTITISSRASEERWDEYVTSRAGASEYHRWAWRSVFEDALNHETRYLAAEANGKLVGVLPLVVFRSRLFGRFVVSLPFVNYGGVVADTQEAADALLGEAVAEASRVDARFLELRHGAQRFEHRALACRTHKVAMMLRLAGDADEQWGAVGKKVRNQVRKAEKSELEVVRGGAELLPQFYAVFARNMRDLGTPVYGRKFFEVILSKVKPRARIFCVLHRETAVAASIVIVHADTFEVPWASSIRDFKRLCPNMLLYWTMLRDAISRGQRWFDFGRSSPGGSTWAFKQQWGAEPRQLFWEYWMAQGQRLPDFNPSSARFDLATAVWRRLPLGLASSLGPGVVRNIP